MISLMGRMQSITIGIIAFSFLLSACHINKEGLVQAELVKPSTITVSSGIKEAVYKNTDDEYDRFFEAINKNWWHTKTSGNHALDDNVRPMGKTEQLTKIQKRSEESDVDDVLVVFDYQEPIIWDKGERREKDRYLYLKKYGFIVPNKMKEYKEYNADGYLLISESEDLFGTANEYVYYCNEELYQRLNELGFVINE